MMNVWLLICSVYSKLGQYHASFLLQSKLFMLLLAQICLWSWQSLKVISSTLKSWRTLCFKSHSVSSTAYQETVYSIWWLVSTWCICMCITETEVNYWLLGYEDRSWLCLKLGLQYFKNQRKSWHGQTNKSTIIVKPERSENWGVQSEASTLLMWNAISGNYWSTCALIVMWLTHHPITSAFADKKGSKFIMLETDENENLGVNFQRKDFSFVFLIAFHWFWW